jgi:DNA-binding response OmpR family regulator
MDGARPAPSLLVVEDDQAVGAYLADNLAADGFGVASARGAAEALRAIEVRGPDLVLLDLMLGDGNGLRCSTASAPPTVSPRASTRRCP